MQAAIGFESAQVYRGEQDPETSPMGLGLKLTVKHHVALGTDTLTVTGPLQLPDSTAGAFRIW